MNLREKNQRIALIKAYYDALGDFLRDAREDHLEDLMDRYDDEGTKSFTITLPDGTRIGSVTIPEPKSSTDIVDEASLFEYAEERDGITTETIPATAERTIKKLSPKWLDALKQRAVEGDDGTLVDPETGEVIPGLKVTPGARPKSFTVRYEREGRQKIATAYQRGELAHLTSGTPLPEVTA